MTEEAVLYDAAPRVVPLVRYADIADQIRSGDLLLCQGTSAFSEMIQIATGTPWSHIAFVAWHAQSQRLLVMESVESVGVHTIPISQYLDNYNHTKKPYPGRLFLARDQRFATKTVEELQTFSQTAIDLLDTKYDNKAIGDIALRIMGAKLGRAPRPAHYNDLYICSEYVYEIYKSVGLAIAYDVRGFIAPSSFVACPDIRLLWEIAAEPHG